VAIKQPPPISDEVVTDRFKEIVPGPEGSMIVWKKMAIIQCAIIYLTSEYPIFMREQFSS